MVLYCIKYKYNGLAKTVSFLFEKDLIRFLGELRKDKLVSEISILSGHLEFRKVG